MELSAKVDASGNVDPRILGRRKIEKSTIIREMKS